jgi:RNA polymerase sigma-70 factor (ECF subfamily)
MDLGPASPPVAASLGQPRSEAVWIQPVQSSSVLPANGDPADVAVDRDSIRLAFIAALQHLPPRQRAVLILREVLRWSAIEVAQLLDTTVASVNSALQRARATISAVQPDTEDRFEPMDEAQRDLLARYVQAFTAYDIESLVALLQEEATASMPPFPLWLDGRENIGKWHIGPGHECAGSVLLPLEVNGTAAFAHYKPGKDGYEPFGIQVLELSGGQISRITYFLDTELFRQFGLPDRV